MEVAVLSSSSNNHAEIRKMPLVAPEDSEYTASVVRKVEIRKMQKMSSEDSEYAENVLGDSENAENVLGGCGTCR